MIKMAKYEYRQYEYGSNDYRTEVIAHDTVYVAYIVMGGSGFNTVELSKGATWREGADEILGVYETYEEANAAIKEYMATL